MAYGYMIAENVESRFNSTYKCAPLRNTKKNPVLESCFPKDGLKLDDCVGLLDNANTPEAQRNFIKEQFLKPVDGKEIFCDNLDDAELVSFDPSLQIGQEVDICADKLNNFINDNIK